jgi:hypothetical protein
MPVILILVVLGECHGKVSLKCDIIKGTLLGTECVVYSLFFHKSPLVMPKEIEVETCYEGQDCLFLCYCAGGHKVMVSYHGQVETPHCMKLVIVNVNMKLTGIL